MSGPSDKFVRFSVLFPILFPAEASSLTAADPAAHRGRRPLSLSGRILVSLRKEQVILWARPASNRMARGTLPTSHLGLKLAAFSSDDRNMMDSTTPFSEEPPEAVRRHLHAANNRLGTILNHAEAALLGDQDPTRMQEALETVCKATLELSEILKELRRTTAAKESAARTP